MRHSNLFSNLILERGYDYYMAGRVDSIKKTSDGWSAVVTGLDDYSVGITINGNSVDSMECSCPYAVEGGNCKHMAAVLYAVEGSSKSKSKENRYDFINSVSKDKRLCYLTDLLTGNEQIYTHFRARFEDVSDFNVDDYIYQLDRTIVAHMNRDGYINHYSITDFESDVSIILTAFDRLSETDDYEKILKMAMLISDRVGELEIDDSDGTVPWIMEHVMNGLLVLLDSKDKNTQKATFRWICDMAFVKNANYLPDIFLEPFTVCFNDPVHISKKTDLIDKRIDELYKEGKVEYYVWKWLEIKVMLMELIGAGITTIEKTLLEHAGISEVIMELAVRYERNGNLPNALRILRHGIDEAEGDWLKSRFSDKLIGIYSRNGMRNEELGERRDMLLLYAPRSISSYMSYKAMFSDDEWEAERSRIFYEIKANGSWLQIYAEEKMYDPLVAGLQKDCSINALDRYSDILRADYSEEMLTMYRKELDYIARRTVDRKAYRYWVDILKHMQTFDRGVTVVDEIVTKWRIKYKRRKAMMEELEKLQGVQKH
ncbi:MAG: SWIM zinc finger family protein [Clostridiales bacterium]|nr:SWIM zinc finger family protein [Clostridiales bacterium]